MNSIELSVVIPTYNECENIKLLIPAIEEEFKDTTHEIIIVDDSSPDGTVECAEKLNKGYKNIRVLKRAKKEGIGAALRAGYDFAAGNIILSSDADLSFSVPDMRRLFYAIHQGYDLVIGCRYNIKGSFYEMKGLRTRLKGSISRMGNIVLAALVAVNIHDFSANFRAIRKEAWRRLEVVENTNIVLLEMIVKAKHLGMKMQEIPVSFFDRKYGQSKLNLAVEIPRAIPKAFYYLYKYR